MKKQIIFVLLLFLVVFLSNSYSQNQNNSIQTQELTKLFRSENILDIKLSYLNKDIKKNTNDTTYLKAYISYKTNDGEWESFKVELRRRGNFRRKNCYFPPIKMKINKSDRKGTIFKDNKKLKLVMPCGSSRINNDYIIKEYMAYKLYEKISPYNYKTRLLEIDFTENKGKKIKNYTLKGIFIEDIKKVADRHNGKVLKKNMHPLNQDDLESVRNAFFQFLIGNTDFSTSALHNQKLLYVDGKMIPVPYDFDMSGLVNTNYAHVASVNNNPLPINSVTDRLYRGFKRDPKIIQQVRKEFQDNKPDLINIVDELKPYFDNPNSFYEAKNFILEFFVILNNDSRFQRDIISRLRTK